MFNANSLAIRHEDNRQTFPRKSAKIHDNIVISLILMDDCFESLSEGKTNLRLYLKVRYFLSFLDE